MVQDHSGRCGNQHYESKTDDYGPYFTTSLPDQRINRTNQSAPEHTTDPGALGSVSSCLPAHAVQWQPTDHRLVLNPMMRWVSAKEASRAVNDFALFVQRKRARMDKRASGGRNKKYVCASNDCPWFVRLLKASDNWKISSMNLTHSDACTGFAQPTARQLADMPAFQQVIMNPVHPTTATQQIVQTLGLNVPIRLVYRAKKLLMQAKDVGNRPSCLRQQLRHRLYDPNLSEDQLIVESYKLIPSLLQKFADKHPGSIVALRKDATGRFHSVFVVPMPLLTLLPSLQQVYGLETMACGTQTSPYTGHLVVLMGRDGNFEPRLVAFGLIPAVTAHHIGWFLRSVENSGAVLKNVVLFYGYEHHKVVQEVTSRDFPFLRLLWTAASLVEAIQQDHRALLSTGQIEFLRDRIEQASVAETPATFEQCLRSLASLIPTEVQAFLWQLDRQQWTAHANSSLKTYQWVSTGFQTYVQHDLPSGLGSNLLQLTEIGAGQMVPLEILYFMLAYVMRVEMDRKTKLLNQLDVAPSSGRHSIGLWTIQLTPQAESWFQHEWQWSQCIVVHLQPDGTTAVTTEQRYDGSTNHWVQLDTGVCSCRLRQRLGIVCRHFIATARVVQAPERILCQLDPIYSMTVYRQSVLENDKMQVDMPHLHELTRDASMLPPSVYS